MRCYDVWWLTAISRARRIHQPDNWFHLFVACEKVFCSGNLQITVRARRVLIVHPNLHLNTPKVTATNARVSTDSKAPGRSQ